MTHPTKAKSKTKLKYNKNLVSNYHLNREEKKKTTNRTDIDWWESFPTCLELIRLVDMIFSVKKSVQTLLAFKQLHV